MLVDGNMSTEAYSEAYQRYNSNREELKEEISNLQTDNYQYRNWLNKGVHLLKNLKQHYSMSSVEQKQKLLSSIFPENLFFEKGKCRTKELMMFYVIFCR